MTAELFLDDSTDAAGQKPGYAEMLYSVPCHSNESRFLSYDEDLDRAYCLSELYTSFGPQAVFILCRLSPEMKDLQ
ncbi:unnamed protein product [Dovyalis caffra]|uniref:Uncharacterized protein n=1 Tax=Dovyalis caffra TaxID=77055 RepID=A0AAV1QM18_9ROSI|nr:unnamed protein product [Dovyalis caffra]